MFELDGLVSGYGDLVVLRDISLQIGKGDFVGIIGSNAAGKSTLIRAAVGLLPRMAGSVRFDGEEIGTLTPYAIASRGLAVVLEHSVIARLSVHENLILGAYRSVARPAIKANLEQAFSLFPVLARRRRQLAGSLSGGEQQMLCVARALMSSPKMLILDEPSVGLSPVMNTTILRALRQQNSTGTTVLLVEQNVTQTLRFVQRAYVIENGRIVRHGVSAELVASRAIQEAYLGL